MTTSTPRTITAAIQEFASELSPDQSLLTVPVNPHPSSLLGECFDNVAAAVQRAGGSIIYGWLFWEWPEVLLEAEFHAIWRRPDGSLLDVTPQADGEAEILFLPDPAANYREQRIDNHRRALSGERLVADFLIIAPETARVCIPGAPVTLEAAALLTVMAGLTGMLKARKTADDLCFCGSSEPYRSCHGIAFDQVSGATPAGTT